MLIVCLQNEFAFTLRQAAKWRGATGRGGEPAAFWSAVTCHRFFRLGDLSPKQRRVQRRGERLTLHASHDGSFRTCCRACDCSTATSRLPKARTSPRTPNPVAARDGAAHRRQLTGGLMRLGCRPAGRGSIPQEISPAEHRRPSAGAWTRCADRPPSSKGRSSL